MEQEKKSTEKPIFLYTFLAKKKEKQKWEENRACEDVEEKSL